MTIELQIKELLKENFGANPDKVSPETTIQSFNMVSEHVDDFFESYMNTFKIDMSAFNYYDYFFEDVHPIHMLRDVFYRIFKPEKVRKKPITFSHLIKVVEQGKWFVP